MATNVTLFKSTDTGASALTGQTGALTTILDETLCCKRQFTAVSGASFVDNSTEARLEAGTVFALFQGPTATNDEAYFGLQRQFGRIKLVFGTAGVQGSAVTLSWRYWNGSAWTALSGVSDGTSGLTADGTVTFTVPGDWATTAVNGVTVYWVQLRFTAGSWSTNPLMNTATVGPAWTVAFSGTNKRVYRQAAGNGFMIRIDDNATGTGGAKEALIKGAESFTDVDTASGPFPSSGQSALTNNGLIVRKSNTADSTTRVWLLLADDRTFIGPLVKTGDTPTYNNDCYFGDINSFLSGDGYRTVLIARSVENSAAANGVLLQSTGLGTALAGNFAARSYVGTGTSVTLGHHGDIAKANSSLTIGFGNVAYPNGPDGGLYAAPVFVSESAASHIRGTLRGVWHFCHAIASVSDLDTFSGTGTLAGKTFLALKTFTASTNNDSVLFLETSDTWDTSS